MSITIIGDRPNDPKNLIFGSQEVLDYVGARLTIPYNNPTTGACNQFVDDILFACRELMRSGKKIAAIKLLKGCFPLGLKEAKDFIELNFPE